MRVIALSGAQSIQHPTFGTAEVGSDGVFDLPTDFGEELVAHKGQFITEGEHVANQVRESVLELSDPHKVPQILHDLRARIVALEEKLAGKSAPSKAVAEVKKLEVAAEKKVTAAEKKDATEAKRQATIAAKVFETPLTPAEKKVATEAKRQATIAAKAAAKTAALPENKGTPVDLGKNALAEPPAGTPLTSKEVVDAAAQLAAPDSGLSPKSDVEDLIGDTSTK